MFDFKKQTTNKLEELESVVEQFGLDVPPLGKVKWNLRGKTAGKCSTRPPYDLHLHPELAEMYEQKYIDRTVVHEYAHAVTMFNHPDSSPHGSEWKAVMSYFGAEPTRCHSYDVEKLSTNRDTVKTACGCPDLIRMASPRRANNWIKKRYYCRVCKQSIRIVGYKATNSATRQTSAPRTIKKGTKKEKALTIFKRNIQINNGIPDRKAVIQSFINQLDMTQAGANTYYSICKKELH